MFEIRDLSGRRVWIDPDGIYQIVQETKGSRAYILYTKMGDKHRVSRQTAMALMRDIGVIAIKFKVEAE